MSKLKDKYYNKPNPYTIVVRNKWSNAGTAKELLNMYLSLEGMPLTEDTLDIVEKTMLALSQYVTLINFTKDGQLGIVDIEGTIKLFKNVFDK